MKIDQLVDQLTENLQPVRPVMRPFQLVVLFLFISIFTIGLGLTVFHFRPDVSAQLSRVNYWIDLLLPFVVMIGAFFLIGRLSVPGRRLGDVLPKVWQALFIGLMSFEIVRAFWAGRSAEMVGFDPAGLKCSILVLLLALVPSAGMAFMVIKRAPTRPLIVGLLVAIAGLGAGEVAIALHCPIDNSIHIALWHFVLPVGVGALFGALVGSRWFRW
jgi:hypothetical protein